MAVVKLIETETDYDAALERVTELMDDLSPPEGQIDDANHPSRIELDTLVAAIEAYESVHHPITMTDPIATAER